MEKEKEKEFIIGMMVTDMKVIGKIIFLKVEEYIIIKMEIYMMDIIQRMKGMEKEYIILLVEQDMKEIGKMIKNMGKVYIILLMVKGEWEILIIIIIKENMSLLQVKELF